MLRVHDTQIRVRYQETDGQGRVHHANYLTYLETARTELLRDNGTPYQELEAEGVMLVVADARCRYRGPAFYDDLLIVRTYVDKTKGARIFIRYEIFRGEDIIFDGNTTLACISIDGAVRRLPDVLRIQVED